MTKSQQIAALESKVEMLIEFQKASTSEGGFVNATMVRVLAKEQVFEYHALIETRIDHLIKLINFYCEQDVTGVLRQKLNEVLAR
jgi:hypothetical protein